MIARTLTVDRVRAAPTRARGPAITLTGCALVLCAALFARRADPLQKLPVRQSAAAET